MKKEIVKQKKGTEGITLVALVVTVVVLLILSGITITTLFGDNGIISAARKAAEETETGEKDTENRLNGLVNGMNEQLLTRVEPKNIEDWEYETDSTTNTITIKKYKGHDTEVVIPNYIGGVKVTEVGNSDVLWDNSIRTKNVGIYQRTQETITSITLSEGIEVIGEGCFIDTTNLKKIILSNTLTTIGSRAFVGCRSLDEINIPRSVKSIGEGAFFYCTGLTNITIPNSVTSIGRNAFLDCTGLTNITIPSSVTNMGYDVFAGIPSITVTVPFTEGNKPSGWDLNWNDIHYGGTVTVKYQ